ncbi:MAG: DUF1659 domain-containing protein [Clostridioides sp.]|jgi:hypothetical protein|nr:DUF1659 domain-containing protein [Clostridioides sp.]
MVEIIKNGSTLKLTMDCGVDDNGELIKKTRTFSILKSDAINDDILEVVKSLIDLQENELLEIARVDNSILTEK